MRLFRVFIWGSHFWYHGTTGTSCYSLPSLKLSPNFTTLSPILRRNVPIPNKYLNIHVIPTLKGPWMYVYNRSTCNAIHNITSVYCLHILNIKQFKHKKSQNSTSNQTTRTWNPTEHHWVEGSAQGTSLDIWRHGLDPP